MTTKIEWADEVWNPVTGVPFFLKQAVINGELVKMPVLDGQAWEQTPEERER